MKHIHSLHHASVAEIHRRIEELVPEDFLDPAHMDAYEEYLIDLAASTEAFEVSCAQMYASMVEEFGPQPELRSPAQRRAELRSFLLGIWDGLEGLACVTVGMHPYWRDRYRHEWMDDTYFEFPSRLDDIVDFAMERCREHDVYFCPALRATRSRKQGTGGPSRFSWVDLDPDGRSVDDLLRDVSEVQERTPFLPPGRIKVVRSGQGLHIYVELPEVADAEVYVQVNSGLADLLGGDSKHADNAMLRLPGTVNHKLWVRGGWALPVTLDHGGLR